MVEVEEPVHKRDDIVVWNVSTAGTRRYPLALLKHLAVSSSLVICSASILLLAGRGKFAAQSYLPTA